MTSNAVAGNFFTSDNNSLGEKNQDSSVEKENDETSARMETNVSATENVTTNAQNQRQSSDYDVDETTKMTTNSVFLALLCCNATPFLIIRYAASTVLAPNIINNDVVLCGVFSLLLATSFVLHLNLKTIHTRAVSTFSAMKLRIMKVPHIFDTTNYFVVWMRPLTRNIHQIVSSLARKQILRLLLTVTLLVSTVYLFFLRIEGFTKVHSEVASLQFEVASLQSQHQNLLGQLANLRSDIAHLPPEVSDLKKGRHDFDQNNTENDYASRTCEVCSRNSPFDAMMVVLCFGGLMHHILLAKFQTLERAVTTKRKDVNENLQDVSNKEHETRQDVYHIQGEIERLNRKLRSMEQVSKEEKRNALNREKEATEREEQIRGAILTVQSECDQLRRELDQLYKTVRSLRNEEIETESPMRATITPQSDSAGFERFRGEVNNTIEQVCRNLDQQRESIFRMVSNVDDEKDATNVSAAIEGKAKQENESEKENISISDEIATFGNLSALNESSFQAENVVYSLACFKLGTKQYVASGQHDGPIKIWSINDHRLSTTLTGNSSNAQSLTVFERNNTKYLASGSDDKTINIWDLHSGRLIATLGGHSAVVCALTTYQKGSDRFLVSGSNDKSMKVWNLKTLALMGTLQGHTATVRAVTAYERKGVAHLASGSFDKTVKIWNLRHRTLIATLKGHTGSVISLVVLKLKDGAVLASGSWDKTIRLWDVEKHGCLGTLNGHTGWVWSLSVVKWDGEACLISGGDDRTVKIWSVNDRRVVKALTYVNCVCALTSFEHQDRACLVAGGKGGKIQLWKI